MWLRGEESVQAEAAAQLTAETLIRFRQLLESLK